MHWRLFELRSALRARGIRVTILLLLARFAYEVAANIDDTRPGGTIPLGRKRNKILD